jgi:hypothetical protein
MSRFQDAGKVLLLFCIYSFKKKQRKAQRRKIKLRKIKLRKIKLRKLKDEIAKEQEQFKHKEHLLKVYCGVCFGTQSKFWSSTYIELVFSGKISKALFAHVLKLLQHDNSKNSKVTRKERG